MKFEMLGKLITINLECKHVTYHNQYLTPETQIPVIETRCKKCDKLINIDVLYNCQHVEDINHIHTGDCL